AREDNKFSEARGAQLDRYSERRSTRRASMLVYWRPSLSLCWSIPEDDLVIQGLVLCSVDGELAVPHRQSLVSAAAVVVKDVHRRYLSSGDSDGGLDRFQEDGCFAVVEGLGIHHKVFEAGIAVAGDGGE